MQQDNDRSSTFFDIGKTQPIDLNKVFLIIHDQPLKSNFYESATL
jgi:hypothetical protein